MVSRKYLCSAPHPSQWDEKAAALLKSLGGNTALRKKSIEQTLAALTEIIGETKRTGPGRKSNAEHAINFYEHVLELNDQDTDQERPQDDDDESMDSQEFLDQHNDLCELCNEGGDLLCCSTCNLVFHLACTRPKLTRVPTKDDWSCSYCIASGVTGHKREARTRRRASAAVRQMNRLRNEIKRNGKMDDDNDDDDDASKTGDDDDNDGGGDGDDEGENNEEGEESENDGEQEKDAEESDIEKPTDDEVDDSKGKTTTKKGAKNDTPTIKEANKNCSLPKENAADESKKRKRAPESNDDEDDVENSGRRVRRSRRQPILYNPQDCPASEWQSDGVFEWKTLSQSEKGISDSVDESDDEEGGQVDLKKEAGKNAKKMDATKDDKIKETPRKRKKGETDDEEEVDEDEEPIWCTFCKDDPSVPVCCFCACRVCFGKHDGSKLLLCDQCDDEYHTTCLKPPLHNVPKSKKWFCPSCRSKGSKEKAVSTVTTRGKGDSGTSSGRESCSKSPEKRRGPGRPPNTDRSQARGTTPDKRPVGRPPSSRNDASPDTRRGPGRPPSSLRGRASKPDLGRGITTTKSPPNIEVNRRGPGRPPFKKASGGRGVSLARPDSSSGPRRPKKSLSPPESEDVLSPRRIRPAKGLRSPTNVPTRSSPRVIKAESEGEEEGGDDEAMVDEELDEVDESMPSPTRLVQRSRSGRMVRQSKFHDEIDEGEQHLKSCKAQSLLASSATPAKQPTLKATTAERSVENVFDLSVEEADQRPSTVEPDVVSPVEEIATSAVLTATSTVVSLPSVAPPIKDDKKETDEIAVELPPAPPEPIVVAPVVLPPVPSPVRNETMGPPSTATDLTPVTEPSHQALTEPSAPTAHVEGEAAQTSRVPRRKPGARECMQISRRFGAQVIPQKYVQILMDYCSRGKVEHLIRMRERLDDHSRFLEEQLAGLEALVKEKGEIDVVVPRIEQDDHPRPLRANPPASQTSVSRPKTSPPAAASSVDTTIPKDSPTPSPLTPSTTIGATASKAVATDAIPSISQDTVAGVPLANDDSKQVITEPVPTAVPQSITSKV